MRHIHIVAAKICPDVEPLGDKARRVLCKQNDELHSSIVI